MTLRDRVVALMERRGWSQSEIARQLDVNRMWVSRLLSTDSTTREQIHSAVVRLAEIERDTQDGPEAAVTAPGQ